MLKVGIFTDTYFPQVNGVAISIATLKTNLEILGHEVHVFTTTNPKIPQEEKNIYRISSIPVVCEHRLATFYKVHLATKIKSLNLDIVHTHTEFSLGVFGRLMAKRLKIPHIHTYHTIYEDYTHYFIKSRRFGELGKSIARKISKKFCNMTDIVIVPTAKVKDLLQFYGVNKEMFVIPTGINLNKFITTDSKKVQKEIKRKQLGIKTRQKVILYIGRISHEKNIEELFYHLQTYIKKNDFKFVLVGDGPQRSKLEVLVRQFNIGNYVKFVGEVPWELVMSYYQIGDVFVSASQSETQGLTYIEALASGLPVVAKKDPCLIGVIENAVNGYTFENKDMFLQALDAILNSPEHKEKLAMNAAKSAKKFSEKIFSKNVETLYHQALENNHKRIK